MSQPRVSIIVTCYNQEQVIEQGVLSAALQGYANLQVVVADDASTDASREVIAKLASQFPGRVLPVLGERNLKLAGNLNRALPFCDGDYLVVQGGDDVLLPDKIAQQVAWMEADPRRVLCGHDCDVIDLATGALLRQQRTPQHRRQGQGADDIARLGPPWYSMAVMARVSAMPKHGFDLRIPHGPEPVMWVDCLASGGVYGSINGVYAQYRRSPNTASMNRAQTFGDCCTIVSIIESRYPHLLGAARMHRARIFYSHGVEGLKLGEINEGRAYLRESLRQGVLCNWRLPFWVVFSHAPHWVVGRVLVWRRSKPYTGK